MADFVSKTNNTHFEPIVNIIVIILSLMYACNSTFEWGLVCGL